MGWSSGDQYHYQHIVLITKVPAAKKDAVTDEEAQQEALTGRSRVRAYDHQGATSTPHKALYYYCIYDTQPHIAFALWFGGSGSKSATPFFSYMEHLFFEILNAGHTVLNYWATLR